STGVDGIVAKPVIDILLVVPDLASLDERQDRFASLGYEARGEFGIPGRRYFQKTARDGVRTHQIHAYAHGADAVTRHLDFRDYLAAHAAAAPTYGRPKPELPQRFGHDIEGYATPKTPFVRDVEPHAALCCKAAIARQPPNER